MKLRVKLCVLAVGAGLMTLGLGTCVFRWLGDMTADALWLRAID